MEAFNEALKNYLTSMKKTMPFMPMNLFLGISYPILGYLLIEYCDLGIYGYPIILLFREVISFITLFSYIIYLNKSLEEDKKIIKLEKYQEIVKHLPKHMWLYAKMWPNVMFPYMGLEINTFLLGQLHDNNFQASWAVIQSISGLCYSFGAGMGQTATSKVSN